MGRRARGEGPVGHSEIIRKSQLSNNLVSTLYNQSDNEETNLSTPNLFLPPTDKFLSAVETVKRVARGIIVCSRGDYLQRGRRIWLFLLGAM